MGFSGCPAYVGILYIFPDHFIHRDKPDEVIQIIVLVGRSIKMQGILYGRRDEAEFFRREIGIFGLYGYAAREKRLRSIFEGKRLARGQTGIMIREGIVEIEPIGTIRLICLGDEFFIPIKIIEMKTNTAVRLT